LVVALTLASCTQRGAIEAFKSMLGTRPLYKSFLTEATSTEAD